MGGGSRGFVVIYQLFGSGARAGRPPPLLPGRAEEKENFPPAASAGASERASERRTELLLRLHAPEFDQPSSRTHTKTLCRVVCILVIRLIALHNSSLVRSPAYYPADFSPNSVPAQPVHLRACVCATASATKFEHFVKKKKEKDIQKKQHRRPLVRAPLTRSSADDSPIMLVFTGIREIENSAPTSFDSGRTQRSSATAAASPRHTNCRPPE